MPSTKNSVMLVASSLLALSCKGVDPAPTELDDLFHYFWTWYEDGQEQQLGEAIDNLYQAVGGPDLEQVLDGSLSDLGVDEAALVGVDGVETALAQGLYMVRSLACEMDHLETILYQLDQDQLYEGVYDSYERSYTSSLEDYLARNTDFLSWEVDYSASILGSSYDAHIVGGLRYLPADEESSHLPAIMSRVYMPRPAAFEDGSSKSMDQDYQIEIFWERSPGDLLHAYGLWRQGDYGSGFTTDDEIVQRIMLGNMSDWDDNTEDLCGESLP